MSKQSLVRAIGKNRTQMKQLIVAAERQGWRVVISRSNHVKFLGPQGELVVASLTSSSHKSWVDVRARLRRAGVKV